MEEHANSKDASISTVVRPNEWPRFPPVMSFSALRDIEICPLRWSLRRASYPAVWNEAGYPSAPAFGTIEGQVVHASLERIVKAAGASDDATDGEGRAGIGENEVFAPKHPINDVIDTLRRLGGITSVLSAELGTVARRWKSNPRMHHRTREWEAELHRRLPALRQRVQMMLSNARLSSLHRPDARTLVPSAELTSDGGVRRPSPLGPGLFAEVPLNHSELGWYGKADLLGVDVDLDSGAAEGDVGCSITDFKTGAQKDDHALQLRIYALLWARDRSLNPTGRRAKKLTIVYPTEVVAVTAPATDAEMNDLEDQIRLRTAVAHAAISESPPEARPSCEACEWCDVKHMCDVYWLADRTGPLPMARQQNSPCDVEVLIARKLSPGSWSGHVTAVPFFEGGLAVGMPVVIRSRAQDTHFAEILSPGRRARLVAAQFLPGTDESNQVAVIALGRSSEAFALSKP